jgi:uncharacterized protein YndB with AHSA1/START domain
VNASSPAGPDTDLTLRRWVAASPDRVWHAWTNARELKAWWGPAEVRCISADIDLRVGGRYRIGNELPDGQVIWIDGIYTIVDPPGHLQYSWRTDLDRDSIQSVDVRFEPAESGTEIVLCHRRIPTAALRENHQLGWLGCLDSIAGYLAEHPR